MIKSGSAALKVMADWGVKQIYGIPGGSINSLMDALDRAENSIKYIQVRHEEVGAMAAAAHAKLSGEIGVCFGSAGPGATHLFNGLYDAKMDQVPVLAIVGQVATSVMNYDAFQELNENPMFADVGVYNRTVMTAESLPHIIDDAIRKAYKYKGVAVVTLPVDLGWVDIPDNFISSANTQKQSILQPNVKDIDAAIEMIKKSKRPVFYIGSRTRGATDEILALSKSFSLPIMSSVPAKGIIKEAEPNYLGTAARVATKPANEALSLSDLIIFAGSDFPFARYFFPKNVNFIQIDADSSRLGKRHKVDIAILGDPKTAFQMMLSKNETLPQTEWLEANRLNRKNWLEYLHSFENRDDVPLRVEPVFKEINRISKKDAIYVCDVGNTTIHSIRLLEMSEPSQQWITSGFFATMGFGIPGGIDAKLTYPNRQIFTLNGDGAFAMVMQDILTQVRYKLPIINIVFSNNSLGFIDAEQEETNQKKFGVDLTAANYAQIAEAMGAKGYTIAERKQLPMVFDEIKDTDVPVVIDVKIGNYRPFPAEAMVLDLDLYSREEVNDFNKRYESDMPTLKYILKKMDNHNRA